MPDDAAPTPENEVNDLVAQALQGAPLALERLLVAFHTRLAARVDRRLPSDVRTLCSADDILQEVYSEAFRDVGRFAPKPGQDPGESFFRWLATIAEHRVVDAVRAHRAAKRGGNQRAEQAGLGTPGHTSMVPLIELLAVDSHTPSRDARGNELEAAVQAAIDKLTPDHREVLHLRYLMGLSGSEVAQRMGRSEDAVHKLCARALGALREAIGDPARYTTRG